MTDAPARRPGIPPHPFVKMSLCSQGVKPHQSPSECRFPTRVFAVSCSPSSAAQMLPDSAQLAAYHAGASPLAGVHRQLNDRRFVIIGIVFEPQDPSFQQAPAEFDQVLRLTSASTGSLSLCSAQSLKYRSMNLIAATTSGSFASRRISGSAGMFPFSLLKREARSRRASFNRIGRSDLVLYLALA